MNKFVWSFVLLLAFSGVFAAEGDPPSTGGRSSRGGGNGGGRPSGSGGFEAYRQAMDQVKALYPKEYAEIEQLMATDRRAAFEKGRALAEKAGINLSSLGRDRGRSQNGEGLKSNQELLEWQKFEAELKAKFPNEYAEVERIRVADPIAALEKIHELAVKANLKVPAVLPQEFTPVLPRNIARQAVEIAADIIQKRYPEEYAAMVALRDTDPDAAREQFRALTKKAGLTYAELKKIVYRQARGEVKMPDQVAGMPAAPQGEDKPAETRPARQLPTNIGDPADAPPPGGPGGPGGPPPMGPPPGE